MRKILTMIALLLIAFASTAYASNFKVTDEQYGIIPNGGLRYTFNENYQTVDIIFMPLTDSEMMVKVIANNRLIGDERVAYRKISNLQQVYDKDINRYFYVIRLSSSSENDNSVQYVMGYDRENSKWQTYVKSTNYYNPIPYAEPWIYVQKGKMILQYSVLSTHPLAQEYNLFWDNDKNWFGYEDLGKVQY